MPIVLNLLGRFWYLFVIGGLLVALHFSNEARKDAVNDLRTYKAEAAQKVAEHEAKDAKDALADIQFKQQQDKDHDNQVAALGNTLDSVVSQLRVAQAQAGRGSGSFAQPVRPITVCSDAAANDRLRAALQDTERQFRSAIAEYQIGVANQIVRAAAGQQIDLGQMRDWAVRGFQTNAVGKNK